MRKVVAYELVSLDGVAEAPDRFFGWDDALDENLSTVIATQETVLLGRRSYDEWSAYWRTSDIEPFATFINGVEKHVATSTPLKKTWTNATRIDGDLVEFARNLKQGEGGEIGVHASISLAQSLLATGVVDELKLVVAPRIVGEGRRLLEGLSDIRLEAMEIKVSPTGHLMAAYRVSKGEL
jgi:dihydrofolate reductase